MTPLRFREVSRTPSIVESAATTAWVPRVEARVGLRHGAPSGGCERQSDAERRTVPRRGVDFCATTMCLRDAGHDRQAEPRAAGHALVIAGARRVDPVEALEDVLGLIGGEA